jgi:CRP-like cAMP-binding protein
MDKEKISNWLCSSSAFANAPGEAITELSAAFTEKKAASGTPIIREGDPGMTLYILASGSATVTAGQEGEQCYLGNISTGNIFGEIAPLSGGRRMASVTAAEDCILLELNPDVFQDTIHKYPLLAESVVHSLERYLLP